MTAGHTALAYDAGFLRALLERTRTIAMVGASAKASRPSHEVMVFLQASGYRVIPVNPGYAGGEILGERVYPHLADVPPPIDLVNIFRANDSVAACVDDAIAQRGRLGIHTVWMQLGIRNDEAAARAEAAGLAVVMNRCIEVESGRMLAGGGRSQ